MRITRRIEFDAGHRVYKHESKCAHIHGHRYVAEVTVEADDLDPLGRVVDFSVLKQVIGDWINHFWDHNLLLNPNDPLVNWLSSAIDRLNNGKQPYLLPEGNPTAENMAKHLFGVVLQFCTSRSWPFYPVHIRMYETPNCWADFTADDWTKGLSKDASQQPAPRED